MNINEALSISRFLTAWEPSGSCRPTEWTTCSRKNATTINHCLRHFSALVNAANDLRSLLDEATNSGGCSGMPQYDNAIKVIAKCENVEGI